MDKYDYKKEYDEFWSLKERWGTSSFRDVSEIVNNIMMTCDTKKLLDVGCGMGLAVKAFCALGIDAYGIDIAARPIEKNNREVPGHFQCGSILELPYADNEFDTVITTDCLEHILPEDIDKALEELHRVTRKKLYVRLSMRVDSDGHWHQTIQDKHWWENQFFKAGFRKAPEYSLFKNYNENTDKDEEFLGLYEKINSSTNSVFDLEYLKKNRDLHMDMTRESGVRADGHIIRYILATEFIQSGDTVLDCACGYGYGTYILSKLTNSRLSIGVDITDEAINYAKQNFGNTKNIDFVLGDAQNLINIKDRSADFITSFETLEHIPEPEKFLLEAYRILKPGGRIIVSVPNCWVNEEGKDPSPYHLHTYTWEKLAKQITKHFYMEKAWELTMDGYFKDGQSYPSTRKLREFSIYEQPDEKTECLLVLAMKSPLAEGFEDYEETAWGNYGKNHNYVDFKNNYINPYIWKTILSFPHKDVATNIKFCQKIIEQYPVDSADYGGALCYLSYRLLEAQEWNALFVREHISLLENYLNVKSDNTHVYRWKISLAFVMAQLYLKIGNFQDAKKAFSNCTDFDPVIFSPTIATKIMLSYNQMALLDVANKNIYWQQSIDLLKHLFNNINWSNIYGDEEKPIPLGLYEIGDIFKIVSNAAWGKTLDNKVYPLYMKTSKNNQFNSTNKEKTIYDLEKQVSEKEEARQQLEKMLEEVVVEKERQITEKEEARQQLEKMLEEAVVEKERQITEKEEARQQLEKMLEEAVVEKNRQISEKEEARQQLEKIMKEVAIKK